MKNDLLWLTAFAGCTTTLIVFMVTGGILQPVRQSVAWVAREAETASVFLVPSITAAQIQGTYHARTGVDPVTGVSQPLPSSRVRILIVPGHQPDKGGTTFQGVHERDVVVDIADSLAMLLSQNPRYDVIVARTKDAWNPTLQQYFEANVSQIQGFQQLLKEQMAQRLAAGSMLPAVDQVYHNTASAEGALELYGINKWAAENTVSITIHLHINDDPYRRTEAGKFSGFAVYVPDYQFANAAASRTLGEAIAHRLHAYHATSTLPVESAGVVEDQQLIAVGSNNSATNVALLIEYGYIYEPQFRTPQVLALAERDYAYATYLGLQDFMHDPVASLTGSAALPYDWDYVTGTMNEKSAGIYALQSALQYLGFYPPSGKDFSECPVSGVMGTCTQAALKHYQRARGLSATGTVGAQTRAALTHDFGE